MFIQTEVTPNPASLKFLPNRSVLSEEHGTGMVGRARVSQLCAPYELRA